MTSFRAVHDKILKHIRTIDVDAARDLIDHDHAAVLDVREPDETAQGVIPDAVTIPRGYLELRVEQAIPDKDAPVVVYCASGVRSAFAVKSLHELGYTNAVNLAGGFDAWKGSGQPWSQPRTLTPDQTRRYSRHLLIPEIGDKGQQKLLDAKVLLIGAGGLGSPAALYLAAAGVGTIGVIDDDQVDASNLQRQVIHSTDDIGRPKVDSARETIESLNPDVKVVTHQLRLTKDNVLDIFRDYDVIVDGSDNFSTRYIVNDACVLLKKPQVHGSIFRFDGQVTVFDPRQAESPCYRCLYPEPPPPELAPNCAEAGVLGLLPGTVGMIQATEAAKLILDIGEPLTGRLLMYDALAMSFRTLRLKRDPDCPMCGPSGPDSLDAITYSDISCAIPVGVH
jgi:sulfur-carrier protein adenylyltransferase/sulfurtransferase